MSIPRLSNTTRSITLCSVAVVPNSTSSPIMLIVVKLIVIKLIVVKLIVVKLIVVKLIFSKLIVSKLIVVKLIVVTLNDVAPIKPNFQKNILSAIYIL
jgi:hypothetical protein